MFSKALKISTFIICTVIFGVSAYLSLLSSYGDKLKLFVKMLGNSKVISNTNEQIIVFFLLLGTPVAIFFAFLMRAIDWRRKEHDGGKVWFFGGILAYLIFWGMCFLIEVFGFVMFIGYLLCILAIFVKQGQMESDGGSDSGSDSCGSYGDGDCAYGGCQ